MAHLVGLWAAEFQFSVFTLDLSTPVLPSSYTSKDYWETLSLQTLFWWMRLQSIFKDALDKIIIGECHHLSYYVCMQSLELFFVLIFLTINEFCGEIYKNLLTPRPPFLILFGHAKSHIVRVALVAADLQQSSSLRELHQDPRKTFTLPNHLEGNP